MAGSSRLLLLGPVQVERAGAPVQGFESRKALALLCYLAAQQQPVSRPFLADLFWGDKAEARGRANLSRVLHNLSTLLPDCLRADRHTLQCPQPSPFWLDLIAFDKLVKQVDAEALAAATGLYRGDFMAGFYLDDCPDFEAWLVTERERWRLQVSQVLQSLIDHYTQTQQYRRARDYATRLLDLDPCDEAAHRRMMLLLAYSGRRTAALAQYERCCQILTDELGVEPAETTIALYEAIRAGQQSRETSLFKDAAGWEQGSKGVGEVLPQSPPPAVNQGLKQQIRFCISPDDVRIAYAASGEGPPLVKAANWLSHLEFDWNSPVWRHWLTGLSECRTLVRYDERGCGLSDWDVEAFSFEAWVQDLETVVNAMGLERFPLLGISQGGPVAVAYAARHPEKVSHLILYGGYARGWLKRARTPQQREEAELVLKLAEIGWGRDNPLFRQVFTAMFIPEGTAEQMHWFDDLQRMSTSPENAVRFLQVFYEIDVRHLAPKVAAPTLVLHAHQDAAVTFDEGRLLAALIPDARFIPLESKNHILLEHEPAWQQLLAEVYTFIGAE